MNWFIAWIACGMALLLGWFLSDHLPHRGLRAWKNRATIVVPEGQSQIVEARARFTVVFEGNTFYVRPGDQIEARGISYWITTEEEWNAHDPQAFGLALGQGGGGVVDQDTERVLIHLAELNMKNRPDAAERRRYALLQAAATIRNGSLSYAGGGTNLEYVEKAETLLAIIERREKGQPG